MKFIAALVLLQVFCPIIRAQDQDVVYPPRIHEMSVALFNQKDFTGWTFVTKTNTDPLKTWSVTNGVIHCTGAPTGYLRTTQTYSNYFLTVVWRFVKVAPKADNTGILVHIQPPDKIWPQCVQVQGRHNHQGDIFLMEGAEAMEHKGKDKNTPVPLQGDPVEVAVGEWNKAETICIHGKVESFMNSKFVNEVTECTVDSGYIGIQSEGGEFEIRSIDYAPLKY
ncbi:MAG: DUF1080 domain-containing protein [Verrucomicrobiae bacterium]